MANYLHRCRRLRVALDIRSANLEEWLHQSRIGTCQNELPTAQQKHHLDGKVILGLIWFYTFMKIWYDLPSWINWSNSWAQAIWNVTIRDKKVSFRVWRVLVGIGSSISGSSGGISAAPSTLACTKVDSVRTILVCFKLSISSRCKWEAKYLDGISFSHRAQYSRVCSMTKLKRMKLWWQSTCR